MPERAADVGDGDETFSTDGVPALNSFDLEADDQEFTRTFDSSGADGQQIDLPDHGDPHWLTEGSRVALQNLKSAQQLNGQVGIVIGFDDDTGRYRVCLHEGDGRAKLVAKKNLRLLTMENKTIPTPAASTNDSRPSSAPSPEQSLHGVVRTDGTETGNRASNASADLVDPEVVWRSLNLVDQEKRSLWASCDRRQLHGTPGDEREVWLRLNIAVDAYREVAERYEEDHGQDAALKAAELNVFSDYERCLEVYSSMRSWLEMTQDELSLARRSVQQHGLMRTLAMECMEVTHDVASVAEVTSDVVRRGSEVAPGIMREASNSVWQRTQAAGELVVPGMQSVAAATGDVMRRGSEVAPELMRQATSTIIDGTHAAGELVVPSMQSVAEATGDVVRQGSEVAPALLRQASRRIQESTQAAGGLLGPGLQSVTDSTATVCLTLADRALNRARTEFRRCCSILLAAFVLCYVVPLILLVPFAPLNAIMAQMGAVWSLLALACPSRWAQRKGGRLVLLLLYPACFVVLPLALHYGFRRVSWAAGDSIACNAESARVNPPPLVKGMHSCELKMLCSVA